MIDINRLLHLAKVNWKKRKVRSLEHQFIAISNLIDNVKFASFENQELCQEKTDFVIFDRNDKHEGKNQENDFLFIAPKSKNRTYLVPNIL